MTAAVLDDYPDPGRVPSAVLAVLVHLALFALLYFGVQWRSAEPAAVEVELWNSPPAIEPPRPVVEPPAPPQVVPEPPPQEAIKPEPEPLPKAEPKPEPKPDIALKKELEKKKKREEQRRIDDEKQKLSALREQALQEQRDRVRKESQMLVAQNQAIEEQNQRAAQRAAAANRSRNEYVARIKAKVRSNIVIPEGMVGNPEAVFDVVQIPSGDILSAKLVKSSGNEAYDRAVERAILKSSPLPRPDEPGLFNRNLQLRFRPQESN